MFNAPPGKNPGVALSTPQPVSLGPGWSCVQNRTVDATSKVFCLPGSPPPQGGGVWQVLGLLVPVSSNTSRCFQFRPINPLVWAGALPHKG